MPSVQFESYKGIAMDRLSIILTLAVGSVTMGTLIIFVLSMSWYSWLAIGGAAGIGFLVTWPISYLISRRIKRQDPNWDETEGKRVKGAIPDSTTPEV